MPVAYVMTPEVLSKFKEPFGVLICGSFAQTAKKLKELADKEKPPMIVSVGDTVSRNLHEHKLVLQLSITDSRNLRRKVQRQTFLGTSICKVKNPMGTITQEAVAAIKEALKAAGPIHIVVEGEEDMLVLPAVLYAPKDAYVVYGQPHEGIVVVKVTEEKRLEAQEIWEKMKKIS